MTFRFLFLALATFAAAAGAEPIVRPALINGPSIIAFAPPEVRDQTDDGAIEGIAHVRFALQDTKQCLGSKQVQFAFEYADVIELQNGENSERLQVNELGQGFGAVLVEPGRPARLVFTTVGPSTLLVLLPQAAAEYWNVKTCEIDG